MILNVVLFVLVCCLTVIKMEGKLVALYLFNLPPQIWNLCQLFFLLFFPTNSNDRDFGYGSYSSLSMSVEKRVKKEVKVAFAELLHGADSSALLERLRVGYGVFYAFMCLGLSVPILGVTRHFLAPGWKFKYFCWMPKTHVWKINLSGCPGLGYTTVEQEDI